MNLLPLIHKPRKSQHFACPLTGTMFKTQQFRSSVNQSQISTLTYASPEIKSKSKLYSYKTQQKLPLAPLQQQPTGRKTDMKKIDRVKQYHTIDNIKSKIEQTLQSNKNPQKSARIKQSVFIFPQVEVLPLNLIQKYEDIANYKVKVSLQLYFKMYFSSSISHRNIELIKIMQKYMPLMKQQKLLDQPINKQKWPAQFWQIKNTEQLLIAIQKYDKNNQYWTKYILILLSLYCIPDKTVRNTSLDNLILQINKKILTKHQSYQTDGNYVLLKDDGSLVEDFIDLQFSTNKLYLVHRTQPQSQIKAYQSFIEMIKQYKEQIIKAGFKNRIKSHFRNQIVPNKCDEEHNSVNYKVDYPKYVKQKNIAFNRAIKLIQKKKQRSRNNLTTLSVPIPPSIRPKSKEKIWKQQNVQDTQTFIQTKNSDLFHFQINIGKKSLQLQAVQQFQKYHEKSKQIKSTINQDEIYIGVLENNHPVLRSMAQSKFHSLKLPLIYSILLRRHVENNYSPTTIMKWYSFVQLFVFCSKFTQALVQIEDCYQIVRNFVEDYLQIKNQDYFREQLAAKIFRMSQGDKSSANLVQEIIWSWLNENGFVKHEAVQKQLLWTFSQRSKTFYLLLISMIFATFKTTPMDLAHQLLL